MATATVTHDFVAGTLIESAEVDQNFTDLANFLNTEAIQRDGSVAFTAIPTLPSSDPTSDNQATRKLYVDNKFRGVLGRVGQGVHAANALSNGSWEYIDEGGAGGSPLKIEADLEAGRYYMAVLNIAALETASGSAMVQGRILLDAVEQQIATSYYSGTGPGPSICITRVWQQGSDAPATALRCAMRHYKGSAVTLTATSTVLSLIDLGT